MKMNEWLEEIDRKEADILEQCMSETIKQSRKRKEEKARAALQEQMVLEKIHEEMKTEKITEKKGYSIHFSRRVIFVWIAATVLAIGTVAVAAEDAGKWLAGLLGFSQKTEELEGGFVNINKSVACDGITITATRAIGDKNCQWIELDTNILWSDLHGGSIDYEINRSFFYDGKEMDAGSIVSCDYEKDGYVSIITCIEGVENINQAEVNLEIKGFRGIRGEGGKDSCNRVWKLAWKNNYEENVRTVIPKYAVEIKDIDGSRCKIDIEKIEITPISIRIKAEGNCYAPPMLQKIIFQDKTELKISSMSSARTSGNKAKGEKVYFDTFYSLDSFGLLGNKFTEEELKKMNLENIDYLTIAGGRIDIDE